MGVYAETRHGEIACKNKKTALQVAEVLIAQAKKSDTHGNSFAGDVEADRTSVYFTASSGRVQNLEWQIEQIWNAVKDIKGVINLNADCMVEGDGFYFSNNKNE